MSLRNSKSCRKLKKFNDFMKVRKLLNMFIIHRILETLLDIFLISVFKVY